MSNLPIILYLTPFLAALIVAAFGWYVRGAARTIAVASFVLLCALAASALARVLGGEVLRTYLGGWAPPLGIEFVVDPLSAFMVAVVAVVGLVTVAGSMGQVIEELPGRETLYYSCILLVAAGMVGIVVTGDLFNVFVHLEVASLAAYALVASGGRGAPRAAMAYLIIGTVGASLYLLGVGFLYAATGTLNMADAARLLPGADPRLVLVGTLLITGGLGIKMALFPLHTWMPAAYHRSPVAAASFMAPLFTKISAYALIRIFFWVIGANLLGTLGALEVLAWTGAIAYVAGGLLALVQTDFRRLLVYSSVAQVGIVALGAGLANEAGLTGAVLHIASDALMKGVLFLAAGVALLRFGVSRVDDLNRLRGRAPWTAAAITVAGFSLIGVPPLSGFFGKWYVLSASLQEGRWVFAAAIVLGSLATIAYIFRILERLYFAPPVDSGSLREGSPLAVGACVVLALAIIAVGLGNAAIVDHILAPALPVVGP